MGVPERTPRNPWLLDPIACRCELPVIKVLRAEGRPFRCGEDQIIRQRIDAGLMGLKHAAEEFAHRQHAVAAACFRGSKHTIRKGLGHLDRFACEVDTLPSKSQDLADSHPSKHRKLNYRTTWLGQFRKQLADLARREESRLNLGAHIFDTDSMRGILFDVAAFYGRL